ncbi:YdhK family protein [Naumannella sp. ID2617S]|nr:YdhK family protein [Naumannella sp. ID2617S]
MRRTGDRRGTRLLAIASGAAGMALLLGGCTADNQPQGHPQPTGNHQGHGTGGMEHPMDGGPAPAGIEKATSPKYPAGTTVRITADHMPGMNGAKGRVVGAYRTFTYAVDYTPTTGGPPVKDHKWVVQQEIRDAGAQRLANGAEVTLQAAHMKGMEGATIASSTDQTVYMVDYTADGMTMTNHKWVVESELQPGS